MKKLSLFKTSVLLAVLALASACAQLPPESGPATPESVTAEGVQRLTVLVSNEMRFSPSRIVVKPGQPIELTVRSIGLMPHDFFLTAGVDEPVKIAVDGGGTTTAMFTLDRPGTYTFICSVPGHKDGGMHGTIVAEE
jgi:plastocyanin